MRRLGIFSLSFMIALAACSRPSEPVAVSLQGGQPAALWDHRENGPRWTKSALGALDSHAAVLVDVVPADIGAYCPGYSEAGREARKGFWVMFLSALAKHESTWRADASGGGGQWHGLLQISPATAKGYGCKAGSAGALKDGGANLSCALRIMSVTVPRDGVISAGMRGVAADWGPFHHSTKRADIQQATRNAAVCRS